MYLNILNSAVDLILLLKSNPVVLLSSTSNNGGTPRFERQPNNIMMRNMQKAERHLMRCEKCLFKKNYFLAFWIPFFLSSYINGKSLFCKNNKLFEFFPGISIISLISPLISNPDTAGSIHSNCPLPLFNKT